MFQCLKFREVQMLPWALIVASLAFITTCAPRGFELRCIASDKSGGGDGAISPDGKAFVISSRRTGNFALWMYRIDLAKWKQLTNDRADNFEAQWSPDGTHLVFTSTRSGNKNIWLLSLLDGGVKQLTFDVEDDEYPCWSPDGNLIAFTGGPWHNRDFFTVSPSRGTINRISRNSGSYGACSFFPDGKSLVYHAYDTGSGNISVLDIKTGEITRLTTGPAWDYKATVSHDRRWIAFSRSEETLASLSPSSIWLVHPDLSIGGPLTFTLNTDRWPTWDQTGDKLFFHRVVDQGAAIKILDRETGLTKTIIGATERPGAASFNPTASQVVYSAEEGGRYVLRLFDLRTQKSSNLNTGQHSALYPRWSPDGQRIAYVSNEDGRWNVYTSNLDGSGRVNWTALVKGVHGMDGPVDWSPDGSKLVFHADTKPYEADIFVIDTRTASVTNITSDEWFDEAPSWTPDGKAIIFMSTRGGNWSWGFYRFNIATGDIDNIVAADSTEKNFPRMIADGSVIFSMFDKTGVEFLAQSVSGRNVQSIPNSEPSSRWPSCSADGRFLLYTTVEHHTEYWLANGMRSKDLPLKFTEWAQPPRPEPISLSAASRPNHLPKERRNPVHFIRRCVPAPGWRDESSPERPIMLPTVVDNSP